MVFMDMQKAIFVVLAIVAVICVIFTVFTLAFSDGNSNFVRNDTINNNSSDLVADHNIDDYDISSDDSKSSSKSSSDSSSANVVHESKTTDENGEEVSVYWSESEGIL